MPATRVVFFKEDAGAAPAFDALQALLRRGEKKAFAKCYARIHRLAELGFELRRPEADYLRDGIYELRATHRTVNHRILYFFHGRDAAVLSHLITKEDKVPDTEVERAIRNQQRYENDPGNHTLVA